MTELSITAIQPDLSWENPARNRKYLAQIFAELAPTDLIILPEMFTTGFTMNVKQAAEPMAKSITIEWLLAQAEKTQATILGSLVIEENGHYFNRLVAAHPNATVDYYDKKHLFTPGFEGNFYTRGTVRRIITVNQVKILPIICYDLRFPLWCRNFNLEYDVLVCVANWPMQRIYAWQQLLIARAIENQSYAIGVNRVGQDGNGLLYNGHSLLIDYHGKIIRDAGEKATILTDIKLELSALYRYRQQFAVWQDQDQFPGQL